MAGTDSDREFVRSLHQVATKVDREHNIEIDPLVVLRLINLLINETARANSLQNDIDIKAHYPGKPISFKLGWAPSDWQKAARQEWGVK